MEPRPRYEAEHRTISGASAALMKSHWHEQRIRSWSLSLVILLPCLTFDLDDLIVRV